MPYFASYLLCPSSHPSPTAGAPLRTLIFMTGSCSGCSLLMKALRLKSSKLLRVWQLTTRLEEYCLNLSTKPGKPQHYLLLFSIILPLQRQLESDVYVNDARRVRPGKKNTATNAWGWVSQLLLVTGSLFLVGTSSQKCQTGKMNVNLAERMRSGVSSHFS